MKKTLIISALLCILLFSYSDSLSQGTDTVGVQIKNVSLTYNEIGDFSISLNFFLEINVDPDFWIDSTKRPSFEIVYSGHKMTECKLKRETFAMPHGFGVKLSGFNPKTIKAFKSKDNQITLNVQRDILLGIISAPTERQKVGRIPKEEVNKLLAEEFDISEEQRGKFLDVINNFYYYENSLDFGVEPSTDTTSTNYILNFKFQNKYNSKSFLKCDRTVAGASKPSLSWNLAGRLSTNLADSLNFINYYPIVFSRQAYDKKLPYELNVKLGHESNQTFSKRRGSLDGSYTLVIPNLINLTTSSANRLRLKPVVTLGVKAYYDYSDSENDFASGQAYMKAYYYIPVFNNYAIILEGNPFYDFSEERNPRNKIEGNYSIALGAEIPKTGFKALVKYTDGATDINFKQGQIIMIGLLMDFFQEKQKSSNN